jgi:hypothetical protein
VYAVYYRDLETGAVYWDNNGQHNYALESGAVVHRTGDALAQGVLSIDLEVKNLSPEKQCTAVLTTDGWVHNAWLNGAYVGAAARSGYEHWRVSVDTTAQAPWGLSWDSAVWEYAVSCRQNDTEAWDNANQNNYRFERVPQPDITWQTKFDGASAMAVAGDGTTFVLSGARWVTGYQPDGKWAFSREAKRDVTRMDWLDGAGILLLQFSGGTDVSWQAMGKNGAELWESAVGLQQLTRSAAGEYLAGGPGGAVLGTSAPKPVGPKEQCDVSWDSSGIYSVANVSPQGLMACRALAGKVEVWDLGSGLKKSTLPDGHVFGVSDAGEVVLLDSTRSTMTAYGSSGAKLWSRSGLVVAPDTQYGFGAVCTNHVAAGEVVLYHRDPQTAANSYVAGIELATGKDVFHTPSPEHAMHPCAAADGNFYQTPASEHYGRTRVRITPAGKITRFDIGMNGALLDVRTDGRLLRRQWAYYPSDAGRIVLTDVGMREVFSASFSGSAGTFTAAMNGPHLVVAGPGRISHYLFLDL